MGVIGSVTVSRPIIDDEVARKLQVAIPLLRKELTNLVIENGNDGCTQCHFGQGKTLEH